MNLQHMAGQISGQVPNQSGTSLPGLPQQSGNPFSMQMQNPVVHNNMPNIEPEYSKARHFISNKIYEYLIQRQQAHEKPPKKVMDIVKRLEEGLFKSASTKEEYLNLSTLENRLHGLIKGLRMNNQNQRFSRVSSSGSVGTMIPTPGMAQSANSALIGTSSVDSSMAAGSTIASSTVNTGSFLPMANVSSSVTNGYQPTSNFMVSSGGNNLVPSMSGQRMTSQMIPTPGFNSSGGANLNNNSSAQSSMSLDSPSNIAAFSSVDSTIVSQPLQQKQHVAAQNSRILHTVGSHVGGGIRSGFQNRSYGQSTGPMNGGGLGMIGNNLHLVNGSASDGYIPATTYGNSPKSLPQHFDQQHQPLMQVTGDRYGISHADTSGSGNLCLPVSSVGMVMNNQKPGAVALQSMSKINSPLITNQSNLIASGQMPNIKVQPVDQSAKMNFQSQHAVGDNHLSSYQHQHRQQPPQQFQEQHQLVQSQPQQKLQNQQHQILSRSNAFAQSHLPSDLGIQVKSEPGNHDEPQQSRVNAGQFQFSDINQIQPNSVEDHSKDAVFQGQWYSKSQDGSQIPGSFSDKQNVQEELCQRTSRKEEAYPNNLSTERSPASQAFGNREVATNNSSNSICRFNNLPREQQYYNQQKWLLFLTHARGCSAPEGKCAEQNCIKAQKLVKHMERCSTFECQYPRCPATRVLINHYRRCRDLKCPVCIPVRNFVRAQQKVARPGCNSDMPNSANGTCRSYGPGEIASRLTAKQSSVPVQTNDLQPSLKRTKIEQPSQSLILETENCFMSVSAGQSHVTQNAQLVEQHGNAVKSEVTDVMMEIPAMAVQVSPGSIDIRNDNLDGTCIQKPDGDPVVSSNAASLVKQENVKTEKDIVQPKQENTSAPPESTSGSKSGKPTIKGVSMTELFTPEQVREHIIGLRRWVGQSKAKAEKNQAMEHSMSENSCQLCAVEKLNFEPPPIYCTPCGARIKRNAMYYTIGTGDTRHYFCIPCYNEARGDTIVVDGTTIPKARMEKKKNDEETEEWWVQCDKCEAWQHQICALFNGRRNDGGQAEYTCPNCYIIEVERGERKPLPQSAVLGAKDLPRTVLSDHIEERLDRVLKKERERRATREGKNSDEVPGAEGLVVRVVSSVDKKLEVKSRFLEVFQEENYPLEFPYKSKVLLLFQKIEGVEVCLFGMYVQEFGSECAQPNHRRVYLSYLDSVKYFRPEIKAWSGEALRTYVYHEILIGYLEYCKKRGFTSCYIWACPPLKGEDYILYCHPEIQKTPKSDKLREWYLSMLRKAVKENIVADLTNLYDHFFISTGECKAKVTAARLPYFDGDYWPGAAEDMIFQLQQEEDGRKHHKKGAMKKTISKRALKASGQSDLSGNATKDILLMHKLGETISPMKEDFIMVHLQHACTHCCILMVSGNRWVCKQCKNFQLCDKCYEVEQTLEARERHPIYHKDIHMLYPTEIDDVPADTEDKDGILESEFFDTRQAFLSLCQGNHYQYDTLRRAKHSSMMVLYHLHNPTAPAFVTTCNICHLDIETGQGWRCETCPDYDVCNACYQKDGGVDHPHKLTPHLSIAERDAQNTEAREQRVLQLKKMLELLVHASQCRSSHCQYPNCRKVKGLFRHGIQCKVRASGGCVLCKKMWYLLQLHARACKVSDCHVPRCRDLKEHLRRLQQQSDSRRRAAVMEMMRQRAAEVANSAG
ncbi:histone acetyltransferase HAC1-like isoform X2 [Lycium barbarum]|uniref:histone acetyltransferase HAC1-like isoform X2 n=2 Tax=Lycium barbarum TaxID=112863 RepID=UPI00293ED5F6|nr:histone acetyltransferase HAC1-like isoform X2 [Lycium barbarum]